jgi:hypothetical protein
MKKIIKSSILALALAGTLTSCNDFLTVNPSDKLVQDNYYFSADMVRANTLTLYSSKVWSNYHINFHWKMDMLNGDMYYTYDAEGQWYFGTYTSVNQYLNEGWKGLYNVISFANSVINDMPSRVTGSVTQEDVNKALGEARCVRGLAYYLLAEIWGDVPIVYNNGENVGTGNINLPRNTQASVYRFALEDLDFAYENLPSTDTDAFRCTKKTAQAIRSKLLVTMASHTDLGYDRQSLYAQAAADALAVINESTPLENIDFSTLFDVSANNGPESIFQIQCAVQGYAFGNAKNVAWSRSSVIADQTWGAGKGPTISLQKMYDKTDKRRVWTYMTGGDYYSMLDKADGGYTYKYVNASDDGTVIEDANEMLAHIKKYVIGKGADCDGNVGINQDAANNIYLMRLADVYLTYVEAIMGTNSSTTDANALKYYNAVRSRAGLKGVTSLTYKELLKERRREFAFESINWFDMVRLRYREGEQVAIDFINSGYETGYNRAAMYVLKDYSSDISQRNDINSYKIVDNTADGGMYEPIILSTSAFTLPIPAAVLTSEPALADAPVDFYAGK